MFIGFFRFRSSGRERRVFSRNRIAGRCLEGIGAGLGGGRYFVFLFLGRGLFVLFCFGFVCF